MKNFNGMEFANKAVGFDAPTQHPRDEAERNAWQLANVAWWTATPMRYDWRVGVAEHPGSEQYFNEIDRRFLSSVRKYMPWTNQPFEQVIPFGELSDGDVLEIGVGQGTHAQLLSPRVRSFTGIDLTEYAASMTARRLEVFGLPGTILRMDAEDMSFQNDSFDYIWSWGVIHHSASTRRVLAEMHRVLRPGGRCTVMIYHRSWWNFYVCGFLRGMFQGQFARLGGDLHRVAQSATDGAIARYYTRREWLETVRGLFKIDSMEIYGLKSEVLPLPHCRIKRWIEVMIPDGVAGILTHHLYGGTFLIAQMRSLSPKSAMGSRRH